MRVDGHGNLYVFPYVDEGAHDGLVPVDVYSPDGERLFAGLTAPRSWIVAVDDDVYGIEQGEAAQSQRIVRYRLPPEIVAAGG